MINVFKAGSIKTKISVVNQEIVKFCKSDSPGGPVIVRAEFSFLDPRAPPLSRCLPPRAVKEEGEKGFCLRVCMCVHRLSLAILYITSHLPWAKTHAYDHTTGRNAWKCGLAAQ